MNAHTLRAGLLEKKSQEVRDFIAFLFYPGIQTGLAAGLAGDSLFSAIVSHALSCGIEEAELSDKVEVTPGMVGYWAKGQHPPPIYIRTFAVEKIVGLLPKHLSVPGPETSAAPKSGSRAGGHANARTLRADLLEMERQQKRDFIAALSHPDIEAGLKDGALFSTIIGLALSYGVGGRELSQAITAVGGTLKRWAKGTLPPPVEEIRPAIIRKIIELFTAQLAAAGPETPNEPGADPHAGGFPRLVK